MNVSRKRKMLGVIIWLLKIAAVVGVVLVLLLYFFQARMIYYPQPYRSDYQRLLPERAVELDYTTACGKQVAFYVPPRSTDDPTTVPRRLWVMFGGNGSLALFWNGTVKSAPDPDSGFLLVDYPGYGKCEGSPSPSSIQESSEAAFVALANWLKTEPDKLDADINIVGHSLGAATALQFAQQHPVRRAILAAPFTSMAAMARLVVGRPLDMVLNHNYDNERRLASLAARPDPPRIIILHGDADNIIPVKMSCALAASHKQMITYHEIPGADHVSVLDDIDQYLAP